MNANEEAQSENSVSYDRIQNSQYLETFPAGGSQEKYYNCICVVFNELITESG